MPKLNKTEINELISLLRLTQPKLKKLVFKKLKNYYHKNNIVYSDGYVYAKGSIPILLVCHLDTVGTQPPTRIVWNKSFITSIDEISGFDDRNGVFSILQILKRGYKPHVLFTEDEEIGAVGATKFVSDNIPMDIKYMIELDRRGEDDCVFYDTGNQEFIKYIESFGFKEKWGSFSDIAILSPHYDIASTNLSIGYYKEHTSSEYCNVLHLSNTIDKVELMLKDVDNAKHFDMQEVTYSYSKYSKSKTGTLYINGSSYKSSYGPSYGSSHIWYNEKYIPIEEYYNIIYGEEVQNLDPKDFE